MARSKLSFIIPVYNEEKTIVSVLERVRDVELLADVEKQIVVVDDKSSDQTVKSVQQYIVDHANLDIQLLLHNHNQGKGAAIQTGLAHADGSFVIIQDADLEYDPRDINSLLQPVVDGYADVVYGSRFRGGKPHRALFFWHTLGNKFLTFMSNIFTNLNLTDIETCYKLFRKEIIDQVNLKEKRFGFEPEVTAKISRIPGIRIYEVGISYYGRNFADGKKIGWRDGFRALYVIIKYNLFQK